MKTAIIKVSPHSRFHFGKKALNNELGLADSADLMHSDSLFSALVNNIAKYAPDEIKAFIQLFKSGKVKISSLFYCLLESGDQKKFHYLLPKPIHASNLLADDTDSTEIKAIKKVQFVSPEILQDQLDTEKLKVKTLPKPFERGIAVQVKQRLFGLKADEKDQKDPYSISYIEIPKHSGKDKNFQTHFYFLYDDQQLNEDQKKLFKFAIDLIRFEGLGGRRSAGFGFVEEVSLNQEKFDYDCQSNTSLTLGLSIPENSEEFKNFHYYDLITRGGRQRKEDVLASVKMIKEGAVLSAQSIKGQIVDLNSSTDHPSKRLGICLTLAIHDSYGK